MGGGGGRAGGVWFPVFKTSDNGLRLFYLPFQHLIPVSLLAKAIVQVNLNVCFFPLNFLKYSVYFCGTKDCQVVTDKYFCQIVVGKKKKR